MKFLIPFLSLILAHVALAAEEPAALVELRQGWEKQRTEAQANVDKLYFHELEGLKQNFTKADNIAAALVVDNAIKGGKEAENEPAPLTKTRVARNKSLEKALKPLDKQYWQSLKTLRKDFQKQGNLAGVVAADAEIKKVLVAYKKPPKAKKQNAQAKADKMKDFKMEFVVIGNPNNEADDTGYGAVPYTYRIGKYEVSEAMIDAYNKRSRGAKITKDTRGGDKPATKVSWNEAARFINWLNTSQGHQAAYKFANDDIHCNIELWDKKDAWQLGGVNLFRHKDAHYFLPDENEWYKAAYCDSKANDGKGGYWHYATGSDTAPTPVASGTKAGTAVYGQNGPADTSKAGGLSSYGTMAQSGNVWEWGESAKGGGNDSAVESWVLRGGAWNNSSSNLQSSGRLGYDPNFEGEDIGFRVASVAE